MKETNAVVKVQGNNIADYATEQFKAAYALNMCTVSVSQIVDYNDVYILEQEYDAILNNLNLERMPKDEALLNILVELLNTITFFRIQDIKKKQIDKEYQDRMKNAIWSAVPNLGLIVAGGNPVTMAISLATQVGMGYMNYRKEKAKGMSEKEKAEVELRITAMEQFNALKRELFTTAWRLSATYNFPDEYRLTEKQIKQYNEILMDSDDLRMYERLEAIQDKFRAYPPFWYHFGHAANVISTDMNRTLDDETRIVYREKAKSHFDVFEKMSRYNILREDQMTSAYALEYVDILLAEDTRIEDKKEKIKGLLKLALEMAGNANDIFELCAFAYLKVGEINEAAPLFRRLVNEDYNRMTNAKILSRIFVSQYLAEPSAMIRSQYNVLETRVDKKNLFPLPKIDSNINDKELQNQYLESQKKLLTKGYQNAVNGFINKYTVLFNNILPSVAVDNNKSKGMSPLLAGWITGAGNVHYNEFVDWGNKGTNAHNVFVQRLYECDCRTKITDALNQMVLDLQGLRIFQEYEKKDRLIFLGRNRILVSAKKLEGLHEKLKQGDFSLADYKELQSQVNFDNFTEEFMKRFKIYIFSYIDKIQTLSDVNNMEFDLIQFCHKHDLNISTPDRSDTQEGEINTGQFLPYDYRLWGSSKEAEDKRDKVMEEMLQIIKDNEHSILMNQEFAKLHFKGTEEFEAYFKNGNLGKSQEARRDAFAILDDQTASDYDLLFTVDGIRAVKCNIVREDVKYADINYYARGSEKVLQIQNSGEYVNKAVDIGKIYSLIGKLGNLQSKINN